MSVEKGCCGRDLCWQLDREEGRLTITGEGPMWDYARFWESEGDVPPWRGLALELRIEPGAASIGRAAFEGCYIESLTLPEGLLRIGSYAFDECGIISLTLPRSLRSIGEAAFFGNAFREIRLPEGLTDLGDRVFGGPDGWLERITMPTGLEEIGSRDGESYLFGEGFAAPAVIELFGRPPDDWLRWWPILAFMEGEVIYPADWTDEDLPDRRIFAVYPGEDPTAAEEADIISIWRPAEGPQ